MERATHVGPVTDLAVADVHQVSKAIAAKIGEINGLSVIGEDLPSILTSDTA